MTEILNIYKTADWTAQIITDESGVVLNCEVTFKPTSEYMRRMTKRYKPRPRVELPEELRGKAEVGAWL